jgi:hypothetical protein
MTVTRIILLNCIDHGITLILIIGFTVSVMRSLYVPPYISLPLSLSVSASLPLSLPEIDERCLVLNDLWSLS